MPDEPTRRVTITAPGWSIDVHANGEPLALVADTARSLFEDLRDPTQERLGPAQAGFQAERSAEPARQYGRPLAAPVRGDGKPPADTSWIRSSE